MRSPLPLAALLALAGCGGGHGVVVVTVDSLIKVSAIDHFVVTATNSGQTSQPVEIRPTPAAPFDIPEARDFTLSFDPSRSGTLTVAVDALGAAGKKLASGTGDGTLTPGQVTPIAVHLSGAPAPDLGPMPDLAHDLAPIDAPLADLADAGPPPGCGDAGACTMNKCCQAGVCAAGTANNACGSSGACTDCTPLATGHACLLLNNVHVCGCTTASDCPANRACDLANHLCGNSCGNGFSPCNGGCCSAGLCVAGSAPGACGGNGATCADCASSCSGGPLCLAGKCGCNGNGDCSGANSCSMINATLCAPGKSTCCIRNTFPDQGAATNCCSLSSANGSCKCLMVLQNCTFAAQCCGGICTGGKCA